MMLILAERGVERFRAQARSTIAAREPTLRCHAVAQFASPKDLPKHSTVVSQLQLEYTWLIPFAPLLSHAVAIAHPSNAAKNDSSNMLMVKP